MKNKSQLHIEYFIDILTLHNIKHVNFTIVECGSSTYSVLTNICHALMYRKIIIWQSEYSVGTN